MCKYIYVLNIPIFCAIWLKKCDFLTEKLGIKPDPDPKWFIPHPDPDPAKSSGSDRIRIRLRIRIHNTAKNQLSFLGNIVKYWTSNNKKARGKTLLSPWKCEAVQERRMPACQHPRCESYLGEERRLLLPAPPGYSAHPPIPPAWKSHISPAR